MTAKARCANVTVTKFSQTDMRKYLGECQRVGYWERGRG